MDFISLTISDYVNPPKINLIVEENNNSTEPLQIIDLTGDSDENENGDGEPIEGDEKNDQKIESFIEDEIKFIITDVLLVKVFHAVDPDICDEKTAEINFDASDVIWETAANIPKVTIFQSDESEFTRDIFDNIISFECKNSDDLSNSFQIKNVITIDEKENDDGDANKTKPEPKSAENSPKSKNTRKRKNKAKQSLTDIQAFDHVKKQWGSENSSSPDPTKSLDCRFTKSCYNNIKTFSFGVNDKRKYKKIEEIYSDHLSFLEDTSKKLNKELRNLIDIELRQRFAWGKVHKHVRDRIEYLKDKKVTFSQSIAHMKSILEEVRRFYKYYIKDYLTELEYRECQHNVNALRRFTEFYENYQPRY